MKRQIKVALFVFIPFIAWIGGFLYLIIMSYQFEGLHSDVTADEINLPLSLEIVEELSEDEIVLFDSPKNLVMIYDYSGNLIYKYKFYSPGRVYLVDYENGNLTAFDVREDTYYVVDNNGIVIDTYENDSNAFVAPLKTTKCITRDVEVCSNNYFIYHSLSIDGEDTFIAYSFLSIIIGLVLCIIVAMRLNRYDPNDDHLS